MKPIKNRYLIFSVVIFSVSLLLFFLSLFLTQAAVLEKKEIPVNLNIGEIASFNLSLNASFLSFGTITPEANSQRTISLENNYNSPIVAYLNSEGNISRFLVFEKKIRIGVNETKEINIWTILPKEEDYGEYSGKLVLILKREGR